MTSHSAGLEMNANPINIGQARLPPVLGLSLGWRRGKGKRGYAPPTVR